MLWVVGGCSAPGPSTCSSLCKCHTMWVGLARSTGGLLVGESAWPWVVLQRCCCLRVCWCTWCNLAVGWVGGMRAGWGALNEPHTDIGRSTCGGDLSEVLLPLVVVVVRSFSCHLDSTNSSSFASSCWLQYFGVGATWADGVSCSHPPTESGRRLAAACGCWLVLDVRPWSCPQCRLAVMVSSHLL